MSTEHVTDDELAEVARLDAERASALKKLRSAANVDDEHAAAHAAGVAERALERFGISLLPKLARAVETLRKRVVEMHAAIALTSKNASVIIANFEVLRGKVGDLVELLAEADGPALGALRAELKKPSGANVVAALEAWKALAQARGASIRWEHVIRTTGEDRGRELTQACKAVSMALERLCALGIDPEADT